MGYEVFERIYDFNGGGIIPLHGSQDSGVWTKDVVATHETISISSAGEAVLALTADSEAQGATLFMTDYLPFDIDDLLSVEIWARLSVALGTTAGTMAAFGLAGADNAVLDTIAQNAWFRIHGDATVAGTVVCETDDGTTDVDDKASGLVLATTQRKFVIDFASGVQTKSEALSKGGKAAVQFFGEDSNGNLQHVCKANLFDMSAYTGGLQLFAKVLKAANTNLGSLAIKRFRVRWRG